MEPTRYMKRKGNSNAIYCSPSYGPIFGDGHDIYICDNCHSCNNSGIYNDGQYGYDCHSQHKNALFVSTAGPNETNNFTVSDYEVFTHN